MVNPMLLYTCHTGLQERKEVMKDMTDNQMEFITWLITTATDKCKTLEEVKAMNEQIREHSKGTRKKQKKEDEE